MNRRYKLAQKKTDKIIMAGWTDWIKKNYNNLIDKNTLRNCILGLKKNGYKVNADETKVTKKGDDVILSFNKEQFLVFKGSIYKFKEKEEEKADQIFKKITDKISKHFDIKIKIDLFPGYDYADSLLENIDNYIELKKDKLLLIKI